MTQRWTGADPGALRSGAAYLQADTHTTAHASLPTRASLDVASGARRVLGRRDARETQPSGGSPTMMPATVFRARLSSTRPDPRWAAGAPEANARVGQRGRLD